MARSFWVISDRGDENFEGSCAEIPKLLTGYSLNSYVDCKISISVTSKALEIVRVFESALKIRLLTSVVI